MNNTHEQIIAELKLNKYNLEGLERDCNIPQKTLIQAIKGSRNIPSKYFDVLIKELKI
jgi:hypothetical protein